MSVACPVNRRDVLVAAPAQVVFNFSFDVVPGKESTVVVVIEDISVPAILDSLVYGVDYTVDIPAMEVTLLTFVPAAGDIITIESHEPTATRTTNFTLPGDFRPEVVNNEFQNFLYEIIDLQRDRCRSVRLARELDADSISVELHTPGTSRAIGWISTTEIGTLTNLHIPGNLTVDGDIIGDIVVAGLDLNDDDFVTFGTDDDFQLGFDTTVAGGSLVIRDSDGFLFASFNPVTNKIGFGLAPTDGLVHIQSGSAGAVAASVNADELVIEGSDITGLSFLSPNASVTHIFFGSPLNSAASFIEWQPSALKFFLGTAIAGGFVELYSGATTLALTLTTAGHTQVENQLLVPDGIVHFGTDDVTAALVELYGDNNAQGGRLRIRNSANEDAVVSFFQIEANGSFLNIGPDTNGDALVVSDSLIISTGGGGQFGVFRTVAGTVEIFGEGDGVATGDWGRLRMYFPFIGGTSDFWEIGAVGALTLSFDLDVSPHPWDVRFATGVALAFVGFAAGLDGTQRGSLTLNRGAAGNTPGFINFKDANGVDGFIFVGTDGTLRHHTLTPGANSGTQVGSILSAGSLVVGVDDVTAALVEFFGDNNTQGARLRIRNAANEDATIEYFQFEANNTSLDIGPNTDPDVFRILASGLILTAGTALFRDDTDTSHTFGRSLLSSTVSDVAQWSHRDMSGTNQFAISQTAVGATSLGATSGQSINVVIGTATIQSMNATTVQVHVDNFRVGVNDTTDGLVEIFGDNGTQSGRLRIYNGATADGTTEYWALQLFDFGTNIFQFALSSGAIPLSFTASGVMTLGVAGSARGTFILPNGGGGNTASVVQLFSRNGTGYYIWVEDDMTFKISAALPVNNADGTVVGTQT